MPPTIAAIDGQTGNASRGQEAGEFGEFCKIELFGTNLRIEVESGECGYRPCACAPRPRASSSRTRESRVLPQDDRRRLSAASRPYAREVAQVWTARRRA